jgi:hypothetical protein
VIQGFARLGPAVDSGLPAVVTYRGDTGRERNEGELLADLHRYLPGDIGYGHLHASPVITEVLCQAGWATYFILRDPRDVVVSHVHYVTEMEPHHIHHDYYHNTLQTFDDRLSASILGRQDIDISFPNIYERYAPFLGWLEQREVLCLHYEDFLDDQEAAIKQTLTHALQRGFQLSVPITEAVRRLTTSLDPQRSPTFRRGKSGEWHTAFTSRHKELFKEISGNLLIRLGYEQDGSW